MKRKKRINRSGETLVESIVAFGVLLLMLLTATAAALGAIRLNNHAIDTSIALEAASALVEEDGGAITGTGSLTITFAGAKPLLPEQSAEIAIKSAEPLWYFSIGGQQP